MRSPLCAILLALIPAASPPRSNNARPAVDRITINDNRATAGTLRNGVLTLRLEVREGEWHPDGEAAPGVIVRAFAEQGKQLLVPGPLIRVPEGTEIDAVVGNPLTSGILVVHGLSRRGMPSSASDTIQVAPGATRALRFVAGAPGTYYYWATVEGSRGTEQATRDAELNGAFIIDPITPAERAPDRVFVISLWTSRAAELAAVLNGAVVPGTAIGNFPGVVRFTINGTAWPNTERLSYMPGDTVRMRIINTSSAPHPMHLHGFYFDVTSRGNGSVDSVYDRSSPPYRVVTERVAPGRTFSLTWVPERAGNWLFHCHDNAHVLRNSPFDGSPLPDEAMIHGPHDVHEMMGGLVMAIEVRPRGAPAVVTAGDARRKLRLLARVDAGSTMSKPAYGYVLQEGSTSSPTGPLVPAPTIVLKRGEPVSITVVNELPEPTSVHWHGIELESYFDGVPGFAGSGQRLATAIAPGDSFEARFTPPRAGTFIYHPHADEVRQQQAGLFGALLVVDAPETFDPSTDIVLVVGSSRDLTSGSTVVLNGSETPKPLELRTGQRYRLRIVDIHTFRPSMIVRILRDSTLVEWRAIAKDGMPLPAERAIARPAQQQMGNGETYDFEFVPAAAGDLTITVSSAAGIRLVTLPVRIR
jgi:manganese oxidase